MKKIVLMVAAGALMLLLAACGSSQVGAEEPRGGLEEGVSAVESAIRGYSRYEKRSFKH